MSYYIAYALFVLIVERKEMMCYNPVAKEYIKKREEGMRVYNPLEQNRTEQNRTEQNRQGK